MEWLRVLDNVCMIWYYYFYVCKLRDKVISMNKAVFIKHQFFLWPCEMAEDKLLCI